MSTLATVVIVLGVLAGGAGCACAPPPRTPIPCGTETCGPDQLCAVITAGRGVSCGCF